MALYEFKCVKRGCDMGHFTDFMPMDSEHKADCPECGERADRVFHANHAIISFKAGWDEGLGKYVGSQSEKRQLLEKFNLEQK